MEQEKEVAEIPKPIEVKESIQDQTNRLLSQGYVWNPLLKFPRNLKCPCESGKKFKHCHLSGIPPVIPPDAAKKIAEAMKLPESVKFVEDPTSEEVTIPNA